MAGSKKNAAYAVSKTNERATEGSTRSTETDLDVVRANVEVLVYVKARMAELKEMQALSRAVVEEALGDNEIGMLDGKPVISFKHLKVRRIDQEALKEEFPEIAEHCTKTFAQRRFEVL